MRKANESKYIGKEMTYKGSRVLVKEMKNNWATGRQPQFLLQALDNKSRYADKGGTFPVSTQTVYNYFKKEDEYASQD